MSKKKVVLTEEQRKRNAEILARLEEERVRLAQTEWGTPLINSAFTLSLVMGMSVGDISQNAVNLGWDEIRLPNPLYEGDTVYAQSEVLEKRESNSRPHQGIVTIRTTGMNQDGLPVITFKRTVLVYKRGYTPKAHRPVLQP